MRNSAPRRSKRDVWARLLLVLLLTLAPALNLAAPMAPGDSDSAVGGMTQMADASIAASPSEPCTHANVLATDDGRGCGASDHAGGAHHADPLCLQCVAFGAPGLPGAPDIVVTVSTSVVEASYLCYPDTKAAARDLAAQGCRGPPVAV